MSLNGVHYELLKSLKRHSTSTTHGGLRGGLAPAASVPQIAELRASASSTNLVCAPNSELMLMADWGVSDSVAVSNAPGNNTSLRLSSLLGI